MRKEIRAAFERWAIAYHQKLSKPRYPNQILAVEIHEWMGIHGEWRTSLEIAIDLKQSLDSVRKVMMVISKHWGYEVSRKGYRRIN